jgi:putative dehydrogenase
MSGHAVGVVGLGAMGGAIARRLVAHGSVVVGVDPDPARRTALEAAGGTCVGSVGALVGRAGLVLTLLPTADALHEVVAELADAGGGAMGEGSIVAEMSTLALEAKVAARDRLASVGVAMLDSPLSGTAVQAERGDLVVYVSGDADVAARCEPVFRHVARSVIFMGPFGTGTKTKLVANLLVAVHIVAAAEALVLAEQAGLDLPSTLEALMAGAATSRMLEVRGPMMVARAFDPPSMTVRLFRKDLALIDDFARSVGAPAPLLETATAWYRTALEEGRAEQDTAAVFAALAGATKSSALPS